MKIINDFTYNNDKANDYYIYYSSKDGNKKELIRLLLEKNSNNNLITGDKFDKVNLTVEKSIKLIIGKELNELLLNTLGLKEIFHKNVNEISSDELFRLELYLSIEKKIELIVVDIPNLEQINVKSINEIIANEQIVIVYISNDMNCSKKFSNVYCLTNSKLNIIR